jgi:hypothetical protein
VACSNAPRTEPLLPLGSIESVWWLNKVMDWC